MIHDMLTNPDKLTNHDMLTNPDKLTNHDTLTKYVDWI